METQPLPKIVWAVTREEHREGKELLKGAICSNLNLFDNKAEPATAVAILRGHKNARACIAHYRKLGARIVMFDAPPPPPPEPEEDEIEAAEADPENLAAELGEEPAAPGRKKQRKQPTT